MWLRLFEYIVTTFVGGLSDMTTARVKYRTFVPFGWIAVKFCNVDFFGDETELLNDMWKEVQYEKYNTAKFSVDRIQTSIRLHEVELDKIRQRIKETKRRLLIWKTAEEKELKSKEMALVRNIENERAEKDLLENDMFYDAMELVSKAERCVRQVKSDAKGHPKS